VTYQVLARKWRPQDFASLIGQEPVVTALRNALVERRIAQAYLFAGIRGVGKTTAARVLAKALNCERGPAADPCNECLPCREITAGADLDVLEIDAATYSKVEQVRELTESLRYGPARDRYKVVVLDEVHRLSRQAFDALLKIVEEPPPHLVFVFATTEAEAVPATILSRCQEYRFRRVPVATLAAHLERICREERITASPAAVRLVARAGEGSVRDAVALLDQLATYGAGTVADEAAARLLGSFDLDLFHRLLAAIVAGDSATLAAMARDLEAEGSDPRQLFTRFLGYCRDGLHLAAGADAGQLDLPADESARLGELVREAGYENLLRLLHGLLAVEPLVRRSEMAALAVEVALLRAAELPKLTRVEELLRGEGPAGGAQGEAGGRGASGARGLAPAGARRGAAASVTAAPGAAASKAVGGGDASAEATAFARTATAPGAASASASPAAPAPPATSAGNGAAATATPMAARPAPSSAATPAAATPSPAMHSPAPPTAVPAAATPASPAPTAPDSAEGAVSRLMQAIARRRQVLAAHLAEAQALRLEGSELRIYQAPGEAWLGAALERPGNRTALEESLAEVCGGEARWRVLVGELPPAAGADPAGAPALEAAAADPAVQAVLDIFGGTIQAVQAGGVDE
jgi:DNA polymerase-3 subunit gamma/tau